jgi:hypothetical protein
MSMIDITKLSVERSTKNKTVYSLKELKSITSKYKLKVIGCTKESYITAIKNYLADNKNKLDKKQNYLADNKNKLDIKSDRIDKKQTSYTKSKEELHIKSETKSTVKLDIKLNIKTEIKRETKYVMWRINPKQCNYSLLDSAGDLFSTAKSFVANYDLQPGDILCAVASGANRKKGLLGLWEITSQMFNSAITQQPCWLPPYDQSRKLPQYRIAARKIRDSNIISGEEIKAIVGNKINNLPPSLLTLDEYSQILRLIF